MKREQNFKRKMYLLWTGAAFFFMLLFVFLVPPFQSPDEPAHLRYIEFITEYRSLPSRYTYNNAELLNQSPAIQQAVEDTEVPYISRNPNYHDVIGDHPVSDEPTVLHYIFNHPPIYHIWGALIFWLSGAMSVIQKLYLIRLSNIVFVLAAVVYVVRFASQLKISRSAKTALIALTSFGPMYLFVSSGVNNDVLLTTASIASLVVAYEIFRKKRSSVAKFVELAFWLNVGLLTKAHFVPLLIFIIFVLTLKFRAKQISTKRLSAFLLALFPSLLYFATRLMIYGVLYPTPTLGNDSPDIVIGTAYNLTESCRGLPILSYVKVLIYPRLALIGQNFIGNFGWLDTKVPLTIVFSFVGLLLIGVWGIGTHLFKIWRKGKKVGKEILFIGIPIISLELFFMYLYIKTYIPKCYLYFPVQGRYYFPILLPIMLLIVRGVSLALPSRAHKYVYPVITTSVFLYLIYALTMIIQRYYL